MTQSRRKGSEAVGAGHAPPEKAKLQRQIEELEERLAKAEQERDEYLADLQRVAADFENYRKRAAGPPPKNVGRAPRPPR
jgi:molecular chaperone GrpE (heat shock protein)